MRVRSAIAARMRLPAMVLLLSVWCAVSAVAISDVADAYLTEALDIIQKNALYSDRISWTSWRSSARRRAEGAMDSQDTYAAIQATLQKLRDNHSVFVSPSPETAQSTASGDIAEYVAATGRLLSPTIALLTIPSFSGSYNEETAKHYASAIHQLIAQFIQQGVSGWIIDLRSNHGGNMWPMLAGLGPLLGEGILGSFIYPQQDEQANWEYFDGTSYLDGREIISVHSDDQCPVSATLPPVAVLIGPRTASSGEATAIAFIGRPRSKLFGRSSKGLTTANRGYELSDGARIILTVALFADRTGAQYGDVIVPDVEIVPTGSSSQDDITINNALTWIQAELESIP